MFLRIADKGFLREAPGRPDRGKAAPVKKQIARG